jgi:preprotein translocase subunit SecD
MYKNLRTKALIIVAVILACAYGIFGIPKSGQELRDNLTNNIKLGLDLRGGSHLVLQIQVQDAFRAEADLAIQRLKDEMAKAGIGYTTIDRNDALTLEDADKIAIAVKGVPVDKASALRTIVNDQLSQFNLTSGSGAANTNDFQLNFKATEALAIRRNTLQSSMTTVEKRINGLGLAEATVQQRGASETAAELLIEMPGVDDPARIKQILQTTAVLEIVSVSGGPYSDAQSALQQNNGVLPLNTRLVKFPGPQGGDAFYLVSRTAAVTGRDLRNARVGRDEMNRPTTEFNLSQDAGKRFGNFTQANLNRQLAVVMDNQIRNVATIQARIEDQGRITGIGSEQEAADLALVLRAGSLPAGVKYLEERTVGPSLGADSIRAGVIAGLAGLGAVVLVMLVYYKRAGINATLALLLNAIILIGVLAYFGAVLTLPGIAGIILTVGMAVDSNVLIFERIREELSHGKAVPAAIEAGFGRALWTIIDTHVTTIVSCAFLFIFGSAAVKGFAVTLVIGLIANFFTAVFVSKAIFEWDLNRHPKMTELSI